MVGLRDEVDNTNVALLLVLVVVGTAAFGGRGPAALSAVISAVSFEFFFTRPYYSLRIDSSNDVETFVFLLAIGLAVGQVAVYAQRSRRQARRGRDELASMRRVAERVAAGASDRELIDLTVAEVTRPAVARRVPVRGRGDRAACSRCSSARAASRARTGGSVPTASSRCRRSVCGSRWSATATRSGRSCSIPTRASA